MADYDQQDPNDTNPNPNIRSLREAADAGAKAQAELAQMRRENMFLRAGIDTNHKVGALLFKTWEGDDVDALKAEAADLGLFAGSNQPPAADPNADDRSQQAFRRDLSSGAPPAAYEPPTMDPMRQALEQFHEDVRNGVPTERARLAAFDRVFTAAVAGDERVIFDKEAWTADAQA